MPISPGQMNAIANIGMQMNAIAMRTEAAVTAVCQRYSQEGAGWAKQNKTWKDRTSDAVKGLHGRVVKDKLIAARISHGVLYGIHLEKRYSGKYAILLRTKQRFQAEFYEDIKKAVGGAVAIR